MFNELGLSKIQGEKNFAVQSTSYILYHSRFSEIKFSLGEHAEGLFFFNEKFQLASGWTLISLFPCGKLRIRYILHPAMIYSPSEAMRRKVYHVRGGMIDT